MLIQARITGLLLKADAARRLGPLALARYGGHRALLASGLPARRLAGTAAPAGPFLTLASESPAPESPSGWDNLLRARLAALPPARHHGGFDAAAPALGMDLFSPGDVRPVWEAGRLARPEIGRAHV